MCVCVFACVCVCVCFLDRVRAQWFTVIKMSGSCSGASSVLSPPAGRRGMISEGSSCKCPSFSIFHESGSTETR